VDSIRVVTNEPTAQVLVTGASNLVNGPNVVNIKVTAPNGTVANYQFTIVVSLLSSDATLKTLTINGQQIIVNGVRLITGKITVDEIYTDLTIVAVQNEPATDVLIDGDAGLTPGVDNTVTITLTAPDGTAQIYTVIVRVKGDTSLETIEVNGDPVDPGSTYAVPFGTKSISVLAVPNDATTKAVVSGRTNLVTGNNTITITVTARDGNVRTYTVIVKVQRDTSLKVFKVGTVAVSDGDSIDVAYGVKSVVITATPNDSTSVVSTRGNANFVTGENEVIVKVTGTDGSFTEYTITVVVADPSDDNSLDVLTLNGEDVMDGDVIDVPKGVTAVTIVATPTDSTATVLVTGNTALKAGANVVSVKVTAQNGAIALNRITVNVAASNDAWLLVDADPGAAFGAVIATEADANVTSTIASTATSFIVNGTGWSVTLNPIWLNNKAVALDATKKLVVAAGGSISISATGYAPNSEVRAYVGTTLLGTFTAAANGAVTGTIKIPETQKVGSYVVTLTGFSPSFKARWISVGFNVKAGFATKAITITFTGTATAVSTTAAKTLATIVTLVKGAGLVLIDIKGWAAGAKISTTLTKLGVTRATNTKASLVKLKVVATYTTGFGALEKATSKTSRVVITVKYAKP
jgi:hypothetical protein